MAKFELSDNAQQKIIVTGLFLLILFIFGVLPRLMEGDDYIPRDNSQRYEYMAPLPITKDDLK